MHFNSRDDVLIEADKLTLLVESSAYKLHWFMKCGYNPHLYQLLFHTMKADNKMVRLKHLVAGRRGGKTLGAAWDILYYATHPREFHKDYHNTDSDDALWFWCLAKDYKVGRPALLTLKQCLKKADLVNGVDYKENKTEKYFEFDNGTLIEFKSADDPESLRGAGLDLIWVDEAAFIPAEDAWNVVYPSLADKLGGALFTTTPKGKNWYHTEFFDKDDPDIGSVEYRSIDNPYFQKKEWNRFKKIYHPLLFKQEFEASFDALMGVELSGDWLHYYTYRDLLAEVGGELGKAHLKLYIGVDPAISLSEKADKFAMALVGITEDNIDAYLLETYVDRIPFPDQIDMIRQWFHKYRPIMIGVEAQAYQAALAQQALRLPNMPPIVQMLSQSKKSDRLLGMAPLFKIGKIKVRKEHYDFIDEWINYDSKLKHSKDDCLDAVEIALRTAGALLPIPYEIPTRKTSTWEDAFKRDQLLETNPHENVDEYLGGYF